MLLELRNYIQRHHIVSNEQLSREFRIAAEALAPMLDIWINKGLIRKANPKENCGSSCKSCHTTRIDYYELICRS